MRLGSAVPPIVITLAMGLLLASPAAPQPRGAVPRIGVLEPGRAPGGGCLGGFRQGLQELGYVEGRTVAVDYRFAEGDPERIPPLAADLVRQAPYLLWTHSPSAARAVKEASATIPIVVGVAGYLVEQGLAASFARPGGNITGFDLGDLAMNEKRLQLLKEAVPRITRVAVLVDPTMLVVDLRELEPGARALGLRLQRVDAATPEAFESAFAAMARARADALLIADVPVFARNRERLLALALRHRLPTISGWRTYAEAGSLIAYGASVPDICRRSVSHVDKILKGASPGDLPVERPDKFELIVNAATARALGLTLPPSLVLRADEVIQK